MNTLTRRSLLGAAAAYPALFQIVRAATPTKFGGTVVDRATIINVNCTVRTVAGKVSKGFGSMPMGNVWSFPSKTMPYETTLGAMKNLAERISKITAEK